MHAFVHVYIHKDRYRENTKGDKQNGTYRMSKNPNHTGVLTETVCITDHWKERGDANVVV